MSDAVLSQAEIDAMMAKVASAPPPASVAVSSRPIAAAAEEEPPDRPLMPGENVRAAAPPAPAKAEAPAPAPVASAPVRVALKTAAPPKTAAPAAAAVKPIAAPRPAPVVAAVAVDGAAHEDVLGRIERLERSVRGDATKAAAQAQSRVRTLEGQLQALAARVDELETRSAGRRSRSRSGRTLWSANLYVDAATRGNWSIIDVA